MDEVRRAPEVVGVLVDRTADLVARLRALDARTFGDPSALPGWSRLTIVCHLRYGASALVRMTADTLAGRPTSYYPEGRAAVRDGTLVPDDSEGPHDVVESLAVHADELHQLWSELTPDDWARQISEPEDIVDLGPVTLGRLAVSRLLEMDVHGTDLEIGVPDWSATLVEVALPMRLQWLATRRSNHKRYDPDVHGSWRIESSEGLRWHLAVDGPHIESRPAGPGDAPRATIRGDGRDLLALLLGRPTRRPLEHDGDAALAEAFSRAFPGP